MSVKRDPNPIAPMPPRLDAIPQELRDTPRWAMWSWVWRGTKWDKPPMQTNGHIAANNNLSQWGSFDEAASVVGDERFSGLGFTLGADGCGFTVVDLDNCVDDLGIIETWALDIIKDLGSYAEYSPSSEGIKIWLKGRIPEGDWYSNKGGIEVYDKGRYLTVTGHVVDGLTEIKPVGRQFERFLVDHMLREDRAVSQRPEDLEWSVECAKQALECIDPDCDYGDWVRVGMALHWLDENLFNLWDSWSAGGSKYEGEAKCHSHWKSFGEKPNAVTLGSLFHIARQNGFVMPTKGYEQTDIGVTQQVCDLLSGRAYFISEWKKWATWNGKFFEVGRRREITDAVVQVSKDLLANVPASDGSKSSDAEVKVAVAHAKKYQSHRAIRAVQSLAEDYLATSYMDLGTRTDLFHCDNVTLRLDSDKGAVEALAHSPEFRNTQTSPVVYMPGAKCPTWDRFIVEVTSDKDGNPSEALANYMQQIVGFCLTGRTDDQSLYIMHGGGSNGKGAFCRAVLKLLGDFGAGVNQSLLMDTRKSEHLTQFATLYGKRCVITQETDQGVRLDEAQVKKLTGSDPIRCRRMREDEWEFDPTHKLLLATNNLPIIRGTDDGIWRRVKLIPFNARIVPNPAVEPAIAAELSGILNWAIEGFKQVAKHGFTIPPEVEAARDEYRDGMDIVKQFVQDMCVLDPALTTTNPVLYANFELYCRSMGIRKTPSMRKLTMDLERLGVKSERNMRERFKVGIGLIQQEPSEF